MLSTEQIATIKATIPLLESGGEALTTHFYQILLDEHPSLRPLFNQAHQANGAQPRALANGVLMYARHIDKLDELGALVPQIINKHASLQVLPEHYPLVGACLLRAMREVLGADIANDAVIAAWAAAYGQLADVLINAEEAIYLANEQKAHGWRGARRFRIANTVAESEEITSFYLQPADGGGVADFQPGQYIGLRLLVHGEEMRRNYSLSAAPNGREYRISVKRDAGGAVSNYLHDQVVAGDTLELFPPAGEFILRPSNKPLALITAGVGITPAIAMLESALAHGHHGRPIHFIHFARHGGVHAFGDWVRRKAQQHPQVRHYVAYSEPRASDQADAVGFVTREQLQAWLPTERDIDAYFLGPPPFMAQIKRFLKELGIPESQSYYEHFGPATALEV